MIIQRTKVVQMSGITKQNHKILFFYSRMQPTLLKGSANERNNKTKSQNFVFLFPNRENSENNKGVLIRPYC